MSKKNKSVSIPVGYKSPQITEEEKKKLNDTLKTLSEKKAKTKE